MKTTFFPPNLTHAARTAQGYFVLDLPSLIRMKLLANRLRDQVHIKDMLELGLVTKEIKDGLSDELKKRLEHIRTTP